MSGGSALGLLIFYIYSGSTLLDNHFIVAGSLVAGSGLITPALTLLFGRTMFKIQGGR